MSGNSAGDATSARLARHGTSAHQARAATSVPHATLEQPLPVTQGIAASKAPMKTYNVGAPLVRVALDVMGSLPVSNRGSRYIRVIGDHFYKWKPPLQRQRSWLRSLWRVCGESVPQQMNSDQRRNFESAVFPEMCRLLNSDRTRTTPLSPQSDGEIEPNHGGNAVKVCVRTRLTEMNMYHS